MNNELYHHGIKGMRWGVRRYQNADGSLTSDGKKRYSKSGSFKEYFNTVSKANQQQRAAKRHYKQESIDIAADFGNKVDSAYKEYNEQYENSVKRYKNKAKAARLQKEAAWDNLSAGRKFIAGSAISSLTYTAFLASGSNKIGAGELFVGTALGIPTAAMLTVSGVVGEKMGDAISKKFLK